MAWHGHSWPSTTVPTPDAAAPGAAPPPAQQYWGGQQMQMHNPYAAVQANFLQQVQASRGLLPPAAASHVMWPPGHPLSRFPAPAPTPAPAPAPAPPKPPAATGSGASWPPALKAYIQRAFESNPTDKPAVQAAVWKIVQTHTKNNTLWAVDWNKQPLPTVGHMPKLAPPQLPTPTPAPAPAAPPMPPACAAAPPSAMPPSNKRRWGARSRSNSLDDDGHGNIMLGQGGNTTLGQGVGHLSKKARKKQLKQQNKLKKMQLRQQQQAAKAAGKGHMDATILADTRVVSGGSGKVAQRAARFASSVGAGAGASAEHVHRKTMEHMQAAGYIAGGVEADVVLDWDAMKIKGTCTTLEKRYLRLTAPPEPSTVRPQHVLKQALEWLQQQIAGGCTYRFACSQFKSIRQDMTVQLIKNDFTVHVYEAHARVALDNADSNEFNQCQTQLIELYAAGLRGCAKEFLAYRILYYVFNESHHDAEALLASVSPADETEPAVQHALQVRSAVASGNYVKWFKLYPAAPNMGARVMDFMMHRQRMHALMVMAKAFRPSLRLSYVSPLLCFSGLIECKKLLDAAEASLEAAPFLDGVAPPLGEPTDYLWHTASKLKHVSAVAFSADAAGEA